MFRKPNAWSPTTEISSAWLNNLERADLDIWPRFGALVGINVETPSGSTYDDTITAHEAMIGRRADIIHNYHWLTTTFPNAQEIDRSRRGQIILVSVQAVNGSGVLPWAGIAAGTYDAAIDAYAAGVKSLAPNPVIVNFENEPDLLVGTVGSTNSDGKSGRGTEAQFKAAYQRFVNRFRAAGVSNALYAYVAAGITTTGKQAIVSAQWPGSAYVDVIGWDPYTRVSDSGGLKTFANSVSPWYTWAIANLEGAATLPFVLAEYGAEENPSDPLWKYQWFMDAATAIEAGTFPNLKALCYFDHATDGSGVWNLKSTAQSRAGYRELARRARTPGSRTAREVYRSGDWHFAGALGSAGTSNILNSGALRVAPVDIDQPIPITDLGVPVTAAGSAGCTIRLGIYADDGTGTYPGALVLDAGTVPGDAVAVPAVSGLTASLLPGRYWIGGVVQGAPATQPTVRTVSNAVGRLTRVGTTAPSATASAPALGWQTTGVTGALPSTFPSGGSSIGFAPLIHFRVG